MKNLLHLLLVFSVSVNAFIPSFGIKKHQQTRLSVVGKENFDMDELRHRIRKESNPYQNLFKTKEWEKRPKPEKVNIIFFQPDTAEEGMHTVEFPKGSASNIILAFESMKDCANFAANLKAQAFFDPTPQEVDLDSLESYCQQLGVFVQVVPRGMDIRPPRENVQEFGYNPKLKDEKNQLDYIFEMSDSELEETGTLETSELLGAWD